MTFQSFFHILGMTNIILLSGVAVNYVDIKHGSKKVCVSERTKRDVAENKWKRQIKPPN